MVPTRPALTYLRFGLSLLRRLWLPKLASEMIGVLLVLAPLAMTVVATADYSGVYALQEELVSARSARDLPTMPPLDDDTVLVQPETAPINPLAVLAAIALVFALLAARGVLDAWVLGRWRDQLSGRPRKIRTILRRSAVGFSGVALLQLALLSGVSLFIAPVALRLTIAASSSTELNLPLVLLLSLSGSALTLLIVRLLTMYAAAWVAWRPSFLAGSMVAAFGVPLRDFKGFGSLAAWWGLIQGSAAIALSLIGLTLISPSLELKLSHAAMFTIMALLTFFWCAFSAWMDAAVTAMVGHTIGEFAIHPLRRANIVFDPAKPTVERTGQERISRFIEGIFPPAANPADARPSFHELLGYEPVAGDRQRWDLPPRLDALLQGEAVSTGGGTSEVRVMRSQELNATPTAARAQRRERDSEAICARLMGWSTAIDGPYDEAFGKKRGFDRLEGSLSAALVRTRAGSPELRYLGFRPPAPGTSAQTEGEDTSENEEP